MKTVKSDAIQHEGISVEDVAYRDFLLSIAYLKTEDYERVKAAYQFGEAAHHGQKRASGEPYITHPLAVACFLTEWELDAPTLCAALLHDVIEDSEFTRQDLEDRFGKTVADLVDGVSKLDKIEFQTYQEAQAENFRKMMLAMSRDLRVILIKLADRTHNMQTLGAMRLEKRRRIARETLEVYVPIAYRLGLNKIYRLLQDLCFGQLYPLRASVLGKAVKVASRNRREVLGKMQAAIQTRLNESHVDAEVVGREKTIYSIYRKMVEKRLSFSQVLDIYGFRVIVDDAPHCYLALGSLHSLYKPIPGKFKDYIAIPKANGYQSLHTTLIGPYGTPVEIQIRTRPMHRLAQDGVASHWRYKNDGEVLQSQTVQWLQSLIELHQASGDSAEFFEHMKVDLFPDEVYVFSPKGQILSLPRGATPVDFAYAIHTDVGHRCIAARVNQELVPLRSELYNGDRVEIITGDHACPSASWLSFVKTGRARGRIRHFLKYRQQEASAERGEHLLDQELRVLGIAPQDLPALVWDKLTQSAGQRSIKEIFTDIGLGKRHAAVVARRLLAADKVQSRSTPHHSVTIHGDEGAGIQLASCCHPIPGDSVVGSIHKGRGMIVHVHDCPSIRKLQRSAPDDWVEVEWEPVPGKRFPVKIRVEVKNARGLLARVASAIADADANIGFVQMDEADSDLYITLRFQIEVLDRVHLARILRHIRHLPDVIRIQRDRGEERLLHNQRRRGA